MNRVIILITLGFLAHAEIAPAQGLLRFGKRLLGVEDTPAPNKKPAIPSASAAMPSIVFPMNETGEVLRLLLLNEIDAAAQLAADHLSRLSDSYLSTDPEEKREFQENYDFIQFTQAYQLAEIVLAKVSLADDASFEDRLRVAAVTEMVGENDAAIDAYQRLLETRPDHDAARLRLLNLQLDKDVSLASDTLRGFSPEALAPIGQQIANKLMSENSYLKRLSYFKLLETFFEEISPEVHVSGQWLPQVMDQYICQSWYDNNVNVRELYTIHNYNMGYNSPAIEERSLAAETFRREAHDKMCKAMLKLPQFAEEGFKRLTGLGLKEDESSVERYEQLALDVLNMPPAPTPAEDLDSNTNRYRPQFREDWVPLLNPSEFLLIRASEQGDFRLIKAEVLPSLEKRGRHAAKRFIEELVDLLESPNEQYIEKAMAILQGGHEEMPAGQLLRQLMKFADDRNLEEDRGPLIYGFFTMIRQEVYQSPNFVYTYAAGLREKGKEQYVAFLDQAAESMVGPKEEIPDLIERYYQPNHYAPQSPGNPIRNYTLLLGQMARQLELAAPALAVAYRYKLIHQNEYQIRNAVENGLRYYNIDNRPQEFYQFLADSPLLNDLAEFDPYRMINISRNTVMGYILYNLGRMSSSDKRRAVALIKAHPEETFGKKLILGFADSGSNSSSQREALAKHFEEYAGPISKLPDEQQKELFYFFKNMMGNSSKLSSTYSRYAPKIAEWYTKRQKTDGDTMDGRQRGSRGAGVPTAAQYLEYKDRASIEQSNSIDYLTAQVMQAAFNENPAQAEAVFDHYQKLLAQPSKTPRPSLRDGTPYSHFDTLLTQFLNSSGNTPETLGFVMKMIHQAGDSSGGYWQALDQKIVNVLSQVNFDEPEDFADALSESSGGKALPSLVYYLCERLNGTGTAELEAIARDAQGKEHLLSDDLNLAAEWLAGKASGSAAMAKRLRDQQVGIRERLIVIPRLAPIAAQLEDWNVMDACLIPVEKAWDNEQEKKYVTTAITNAVFAALHSSSSAERLPRIKRFMEDWKEHFDDTLISISDLRRALTVYEEAGGDPNSLIGSLPPLMLRQAGMLPLLLKRGAMEAAKNALAYQVLMMPPLYQPFQNSRRSVQFINGQRVIQHHGGGGGNQQLNLGGQFYDSDFHQVLPEFLQSVSDPGQRYFAEFLISALNDAPALGDEAPKREDRLKALAERYEREAFASPYLAEHSVSWLCASLGMQDSFREDAAHFGRQLKHQDLNNWNNQHLRTSRASLLNYFLRDASVNDPKVFGDALMSMLEPIRYDQGQAQMLLNAYCNGFPQNVLTDVAGLTKARAQEFLPLLRNLCELTREIYWNGRDECINGNFVLHVLAGETDSYEGWLTDLDDDLRRYIASNVNIDQAVYLVRDGLKDERMSKERRFEIINGLFAASGAGRDPSMGSSSSDNEVFERMIDLGVITKEDILQHGKQWAESNPRDGAAYGELAKAQERAGRNEEAVLNYLQAVAHVPWENSRLYSQYHLANANLLLKLNRMDAAMQWYDFLHPGRVYSSYRDEHDELYQTVRMHYLTQPERLQSRLTEARQLLSQDAKNQDAWWHLSETLSAMGQARIASSEYQTALPLLKASYYIQQRLASKKSEDDIPKDLINATKLSLSRGMVALGVGGKRRYLIRKGTTWNYHYDAEGQQGSSWRMGYSRGDGWKEGEAPLGYGDGDETTILDYGDDKDNKHITAYFRYLLEVDDPSEYDDLVAGILHDDGMVAYLNGKEIARNNMPSGTPNPSTQAPESRGSSAENEYWRTNIPISRLVKGINIVAVEVHQNDPDSSDLGFDFELYSEAISMKELAAEVQSGKTIEALEEFKAQLPENLIALIGSL